MKKIFLHIAIVFLFAEFASAQDVHFSQFDFSPLHQSAANTGNFNGDYRFTAIHRNQYRSVTVPYKSVGASLDMNHKLTDDKMSYWSSGLMFEQDKTGDAGYSTLDIELSVAWNKFLDNDKKHRITIGLQPGWFQNGLNFSELYFGNQYDNGSFNSNLPNNENPEETKHSNFNLNAGLGYKYIFSEMSDMQLVLGFNHLNKPNLSYYGDKSPLNMRFTALALFDIRMSERIFIHPQLLYYNQNKFNQINGGANVTFHSADTKDYRFTGGVFYRNKDAIIGRLGAGYNNLDIGFAYDFNISDLKRASNGRGAYEIALTYIIHTVKPLQKNPPCPVY